MNGRRSARRDKGNFQERADTYHKEAEEAEERLLSIRKEIKEYFEYIGKL